MKEPGNCTQSRIKHQKKYLHAEWVKLEIWSLRIFSFMQNIMAAFVHRKLLHCIVRMDPCKFNFNDLYHTTRSTCVDAWHLHAYIRTCTFLGLPYRGREKKGSWSKGTWIAWHRYAYMGWYIVYDAHGWLCAQCTKSLWCTWWIIPGSLDFLRASLITGARHVILLVYYTLKCVRHSGLPSSS